MFIMKGAPQNCGAPLRLPAMGGAVLQRGGKLPSEGDPEWEEFGPIH